MRNASALLLAAALAACSGGGDPVSSALPDVSLPTLGGPPGGSLKSCPTDRCLTVVVAPWCGVCHQTAPYVVELRRYLDKKGVSSRVVVGLSDDAAAIRDFAKKFGSDALLDDAGHMRPRGVPLFLVSDAQGRVLKVLNGFPRVDSIEGLAQALGLDGSTGGKS